MKFGNEFWQHYKEIKGRKKNKKAKSKHVASFLYNAKIGVSIIDSFPHCHTENALKTVKFKKYGFVSI